MASKKPLDILRKGDPIALLSAEAEQFIERWAGVPGANVEVTFQGVTSSGRIIVNLSHAGRTERAAFRSAVKRV